jgi:uncharacterized protein YbjT (DUF2867 family)
MAAVFTNGLTFLAAAGEEALRNSGVPYTVVRPGGLTNGPAGQTQLRAGENCLSAGLCW